MWDCCWLKDCHATFVWLSGRHWRWDVQRHAMRRDLLDCAKVGASKHILTMQNKKHVVFSIKHGKYKCVQATWGHTSCNRQTLCMQTNVFMFLLQMCPLAAAHEIVWIFSIDHDVCLLHHGVMTDVLCRQNIFWCTDNNPFNVLCRNSMLWFTDLHTIKQSTSYHMPLQSPSSASPVQSYECCITTLESKAILNKKIVLTLTWLCLKWRLWMINVTKKTIAISQNMPSI